MWQISGKVLRKDIQIFMFDSNMNQKTVGVAMLISEKLNLEQRKLPVVKRYIT